MTDNKYCKNTRVKIIGNSISNRRLAVLQKELEEFISTHDIIEIKQSLCQPQEGAGVLVYTVFYNVSTD